MKKILSIKSLIFGTLIVLGLSLFFASCVKEPLNLQNENYKYSTLKLNILANSKFVTRAASAEQIAEQYINSGYVFIFDGTGTQKSNYTLQSADIVNNGTSNLIITVPITIVNGDKIVVVLNSALKEGLNLNSLTLNDMDASFPLGSTGFENVANGNTGGLPMYGVHTWSDISTNTINVKRSVAKIQVRVDIDYNYMTDYISNSDLKYQLHNYAVNGQITPGGGVNDSDKNRDPIMTIDDNTIIKEVADYSDDFTGASYIYEYEYSTKIIGAESSESILSQVTHHNRLAIILQDSRIYGNARYYRLDLLIKTGDNIEYIDILRNHHYSIIIKSINTYGYATAQEALNNESSNNYILYEIVDDTGSLTISNGKYAISVGDNLLAGKKIDTYYTGNYDEKITYDVLTNVRYITSDLNPPMPGINNSITLLLDGRVDDHYGTVSPNVLTSKLETISVNLRTSMNFWNIRLRIILGDLMFLSEPFSLMSSQSQKIFDCYDMDTHTVEEDYNSITWDENSAFSAFDIVIKGSSFTITPKSENVTPIRWESLNPEGTDYVLSRESNYDAIPIFEDKVLSGRSRSDDFVEIRQLAPIYIGRWGSPEDNVPLDIAIAADYAQLTAPMGMPLRKRAIISARNASSSVSDNDGWGGNVNPGGYNSINNGLYISKFGSMHAGSILSNYALNKCYKKNKGYITSVELQDGDVKWYLPALQQLVGSWVALNEFGFDNNQTLIGPYNNAYYSATEKDSNSSTVIDLNSGMSETVFNGQSFNIRCIRDL